MPVVSDLDRALLATRTPLGVLVDALVRADVASLESVAREVAQATAGLQACAAATTPADGARAQAIDEVLWMLERARRLSRSFTRTTGDGGPPVYLPDGRPLPASSRVSMLEVKG